jgi:hypothetical protein
MQPVLRESLCTGPARPRVYLRDGAKSCVADSLRLNGRPFTCHWQSWDVVRIKSAVTHYNEICQTNVTREQADWRREGGVYLSVVAAIALLVVLHSFGVEHAAIGASRGRAGGLLLDLMAAAIDVYNLGAHASGGGEAARGRCVRRGA